MISFSKGWGGFIRLSGQFSRSSCEERIRQLKQGQAIRRISRDPIKD